MSWTPLPFSSRILPFRNACGISNRPNLLDKLQSRPKVAIFSPTTAEAVEEQDAALNGMTRSLHRRLRALNLPTVRNAMHVQRRVA